MFYVYLEATPRGVTALAMSDYLGIAPAEAPGGTLYALELAWPLFRLYQRDQRGKWQEIARETRIAYDGPRVDCLDCLVWRDMKHGAECPKCSSGASRASAPCGPCECVDQCSLRGARAL